MAPSHEERESIADLRNLRVKTHSQRFEDEWITECLIIDDETGDLLAWACIAECASIGAENEAWARYLDDHPIE